jgi:hypothetical protein
VAEHYIEISLPTKPLRNVDTTIAVWSDGKKLGQLRVSTGSLDWVRGGAKKPKKITWERLATLLNAE